MTAVTSELTLAEILVKPIELGDVGLVEGYQQMLVGDEVFEVTPVDRNLLVRAAGLRAGGKSLRLPDAIHAATALDRLCTAFISDEVRMPLPGGLQHLRITPFTVDDALALHE